MSKYALYSWERLPIYEHINDFARLLGELLAVVPKTLHVEIHTLIGQSMVMSNAVPGSWAEVLPGEPPIPLERRRAWLMIGHAASSQARTTLTEVGNAAKRLRPDVMIGLRLLGRIERDFVAGMDELENTRGGGLPA